MTERFKALSRPHADVFTTTMNSLRFLLVHSDLRHAERISDLLESASHTVSLACGLDEASDALDLERFDAVLLESKFLRRGLREFSHRLREMADARRFAARIPIIIIDGPAAGNAEEAGFDAVMPEPIDPHALTEAVYRLAQALSAPANGDYSSDASAMAVIEPEKFEEQVGYDRELMVEIIDLFLEERRRQEPEIREALEKQELEMVSKLAHTIKGSLSSLHAAKARYHAHELELASKRGDADGSWNVFASLETDLAELEPELLSLRGEASSL